MAKRARRPAARLPDQEDLVQALLERLVHVQEQERRRFALNLHDHLGQQLTALRLAVSALRNMEGRSEQSEQFERIEAMLTQLDRDLDFLAWELRPAALDDVGLDAAVQQFLTQWSATNRVTADFHHDPASGRLDRDVESHLYRIVQEALNNVSKHAQADHVSVLLERRPDEVTLIIEDDGCGFEVTDDASRLRQGSMGLAGIRERAALVGGVVEIESTPGKGTTLFVRIPLASVASAITPQNDAKR